MKVIVAQKIAVVGVVLGIGLGLWGCSRSGTESILASPDLTITALSAPGSAARGATISVIHTTKNVGNALAATSSSRFHLCTNNIACGYRNQQAVPLLAVGASKTLTNTTFSVPADQPLGTNYVVVVCGDGLVEANKANNTNSIPIVITE